MARSLIFLAALIPVIAAQSSQQSTFSPARPPAIPLAVRSPYLSTWQAAGSDGGNGGYLAGKWPTFWTGSINGWCGLIRVDNNTYTWMGKPDPLPQVVSQTAFEYTSTRSSFTLDVNGQVTMNVTFLSPVDPTDKQRQSMPVSYVNIEVVSADNNEHEVAIYTDISAEWTSGDRNQVAQWSRGVAQGSTDSGGSGDVAFHKVWRQNQIEFAEDGDQAAWGYWYYATENVDGLTYQSGADTDVRRQFTDNGGLNNSEDTDYRAINDRFPVFAFAVDLGSVSSDSKESLFTINLLQNNSVQFATGQGVQQVPSFWRSSFSDELSAVTTFYFDYANGARVSAALDNDVASDSRAAGGDDYVAITSLAVRQAWGAVQIAGTESENYLFLKEISSNGNFQTVDVIFPFHPMLLYMNASWMKMILDPLFINMKSLWPEDFAIHDIGSRYPNATGHADGNAALQPLEECGNMLIMTLGYAQKTGDTDYLNQNWDLLHQWGQWLINNNSVIPFNQISTDDFAGPLANQTNLALKGIIGLQAAAMIANMTGHSQEGSDYANTASNWIGQWEQLAVNQNANPPHTVLNYGDGDSFSLLYNLYADQLVQTNIVPHSIYTMQSEFYPTVKQEYGVPLDTRADRTKSDWEIFCAAIASTDTRDMFIRDLAKFIDETPTSAPVTDLYDPSTGQFAADIGPFKARPVVGGWFALLALNQTGLPDESYIGQSSS
ncbi:hypothetical protein PRZ48_005161 [Zasmidium cellare]|uniref:Glutaminase GtaA n=1 Tax=Zasmidium cellare TaxID=395010 RepID=A0ABR0ERX4_ZASCE|nr:hypothetical protein PRZ48_005161 [Zasmidium cellare]